MNYRIGLDIGIGSIGWAIISGEKETARIENFGTRIFDSGENDKKTKSRCQDRRGFRSVRRLERRRAYRRLLLRNHFENIGLCDPAFEDGLLACRDQDVYQLKVRGLDEKLTPAQLFKCLIHTCNHRGYRDFYDADPEEDAKEEGVNKAAVAAFEKRMRESEKRTVSEYLLAGEKRNGFVCYRNVSGAGNEYLLIPRELLEDETRLLLAAQSKFYPQLNEKAIRDTVTLVFNQRAFEDGPGDKNDDTRRYRGFLGAVGQCPFYKEDRRGFRGTVIADLFAVTNTLSQYTYTNKETGECDLAPEIAKKLVSYTVENAGITFSQVKEILGKGIVVQKSERSEESPLNKSVRFLKVIRAAIESVGEDWLSYAKEEQLDPAHPSRLHRIGELLSRYQTPRYRRAELKKLDFLSEALRRKLEKVKLSGTARAGYRYMCDAIHAFMEGEIYGNFQANKQKALESIEQNGARSAQLPLSCLMDDDVRDNPIVFKAINETRKLINAIVAVYGAPSDVIVEVADELGKSFEERDRMEKQNRLNEKKTDTIKAEIIRLLGYEKDAEVPQRLVDIYKLFHQQEGKDPYTGEPLGNLADVLHDPAKTCEIDHIVPYSLILDNTLNNKFLVSARANQEKGQRTPLMFLQGEKANGYLAFVNHMYARDNTAKGKAKKDEHYPAFSRKKLEYCRLETIYSAEAQQLLSDWKSRNINDTRYITKYITGVVAKNLRFAEPEGKHVYGVKGAVTSRFRRIWLEGTEWGDEQKNRESYLNHAADAVVIANLTPAYIEIASDGIKLRSLFYRAGKSTAAPEYRDYLQKCVEKMRKYYGFEEEYTRRLLRYPENVPSYVPELKEEVRVRFNDSDAERFAKETAELYRFASPFVLPPQMPVTSHKQNLKFRGTIADANPIRVVTDEQGEHYKVSHKSVEVLEEKNLASIRTGDDSLLATLHRILDGKGAGYTVGKYLVEQGLSCFQTDAGQPVRRVSVAAGKVSSFYRKENGENNFAYLGGLKYYCVEIYRDAKGNTCVWGIRYVDVVRKDKKLWLKQSALPENYVEHVMYLFPDDYIRVADKKGNVKFEGFYKGVYNINEKRFSCAFFNTPTFRDKTFRIATNCIVKKYDISLLGRRGGEIRCSAPLSLIGESTSPSGITG